MILRSLLSRIFIRFENRARMQSVKASNFQFPLPRVELETNVLKKVITRRIFTSCQSSEIKTNQYQNFGKADETYFDFKELECNGR